MSPVSAGAVRSVRRSQCVSECLCVCIRVSGYEARAVCARLPGRYFINLSAKPPYPAVLYSAEPAPGTRLIFHPRSVPRSWGPRRLPRPHAKWWHCAPSNNPCTFAHPLRCARNVTRQDAPARCRLARGVNATFVVSVYVSDRTLCWGGTCLKTRAYLAMNTYISKPILRLSRLSNSVNRGCRVVFGMPEAMVVTCVAGSHANEARHQPHFAQL